MQCRDTPVSVLDLHDLIEQLADDLMDLDVGRPEAILEQFRGRHGGRAVAFERNLAARFL